MGSPSRTRPPKKKSTASSRASLTQPSSSKRPAMMESSCTALTDISLPNSYHNPRTSEPTSMAARWKTAYALSLRSPMLSASEFPSPSLWASRSTQSSSRTRDSRLKRRRIFVKLWRRRNLISLSSRAELMRAWHLGIREKAQRSENRSYRICGGNRQATYENQDLRDRWAEDRRRDGESSRYCRWRWNCATSLPGASPSQGYFGGESHWCHPIEAG